MLNFLIQHNYEEAGNFGRVNIQATMALSKLAGDGILKVCVESNLKKKRSNKR